MLEKPISHQWFISELVISNFKSFGAHEPSVIRFSPGVNLILGPNGSGKSNALDALAFAGGVSSDKLRVTRNNQLQNITRPTAPCIVDFCIRRKAVSHQIKCVLKEGAREWRIDGKVKSGQAVTAFLAERGIRLGSSNIIRQGNIMTIASSDAASLSTLVADASGLTTFKEESRRGGLEISAANKALDTINKSVQKLEAASSDVTRRMKNEQDREMIEKEMIQVIRSIYRSKIHLEQDLDKSVGTSEEKRGNQRREIESLKITWGGLGLSIQQLEDAMASKKQRIKEVADELASLMGLVEIMGDQKRDEERRGAARSASEAEINDLRLQLSTRREKFDLASTALEREERILSLTGLSDHQGEDSSLCLLELKRGAEEKVRGSKEELHRVEGKVNEVVERLSAFRKKMSELEKKKNLWAASWEEIKLMKQEMGLDSNDTIHLSIPLSNLLCSKMKSVVVSASNDNARLIGLRRSLEIGRGQLDPDSILVHQCFQFTEGAIEVPKKGLIKAMAAIMGSSLRVTVCSSSQSASCIISSHEKNQGGSKLRLWPLDTLHYSSNTDEERRLVIQTICLPGSAPTAWMPVDLIKAVNPLYDPVVIRSLGALVIASNNEVASALSRKGIECVTFDGVVSRQGSISCSFRGGSSASSPNEHLLSLKLEVMEIEMRLKGSEEEVKKLREMIKRAEMIEGVMRTIDLSQVDEELDQSSMAVNEAMVEESIRVKECSEARRQALESESELEGIDRLLNLSSKGAEGGALASKRIKLVKDGIAVRQGERDRLEIEVLGIEMRMEEIQILLALPPLQAPPRSDPLDLERRRKVLGMEEEELSEGILEIESNVQSLTESASKQEDRIANLSLSLLVLDAEGRQLIKRREKVLKETKDLLSNLPVEKRLLISGGQRGQGGGRGGGQGGGRSESDPSLGGEDQVQMLGLELDSLKTKRLKVPHSTITDADRSIHNSRMISLGELQGHQSALRQATESLDLQIKATEAVALSQNNETFSTIATSFEELSSLFLPNFLFKLEKIHTDDASRGLTIKCTRKNTPNVESVGGQGIGMEILSGGQRSMVAMALLLSASGQGCEGGCSSSILLLDEVDAALDQSNQAIVGALLSELKIQVICVSHNASFQESAAAPTTVHISRGSDGFSMVQA